jgi:hypothetical protein
LSSCVLGEPGLSWLAGWSLDVCGALGFAGGWCVGLVLSAVTVGPFVSWTSQAAMVDWFGVLDVLGAMGSQAVDGRWACLVLSIVLVGFAG